MASRVGARLIVSLVIFVLCAELLGLTAYYVETGALFYLHRKSYPDLLPVRQDQLVVGEALHPYFGPTHRPGTPFDIPASLREGNEPLRLVTNNFGFVSPHDYPFIKSRDDQVVLGVFGGSVALWFCQVGAPRLVEHLKKQPAFSGREVVVLCFAHEGYKQPQQTLVLAYFLSIGQTFDVVVNIDGFNEAALASLNNAHGVDISMPSMQHLDPLIGLVNRSALTPAKLDSMAAVFRYRRTLTDLVSRMQSNRSAAIQFVLDWYYRRVSGQYARELGRFSNLPANPAENALIQATPATRQRQNATLYGDIADVWVRASVLMRQLVTSRGGAYFHFLQPNQYATGRMFGSDEAAVALNQGSPYKASVEKGYPILTGAAPRLKAAGVAFYDATAVFDHENAPVYMDDCCHYTLRGNQLLADFVAESMREAGSGP